MNEVAIVRKPLPAGPEMSIQRPRLLLLAFAWLGLAVAVAVFLGSLNVPNLVEISWNEKQATGKITRTECDQHSLVFYTFLADGREYSSQDRSSNCRSVRAGDAVTVYFTSTSPEHSVIEKPSRRLSNELVSIALACVMMPSLIIGAIVWRSRSSGAF
jgi:hypothetical protein